MGLPTEPVAPRRANRLDGKTWTRYSISIWSDLRKTPEEVRLKHPALFPAALSARLIECFAGQQDRVVLDPFAGVGSTLIAAAQSGRRGIGVELSPEFCELAKGRLAQMGLTSARGGPSIHCGDARDLLKYVKPNSVDLVITSPPYWNVLGRHRTADRKSTQDYGDQPLDLGRVRSYEEFLVALGDVFAAVLTTLKPGRYCCVVVMDIRQKGKLYSLHSDVIQKMQSVGYLYDDLIIWDRRHEYNYFRPLGYPAVFRINKAHEFILIFQKAQPA